MTIALALMTGLLLGYVIERGDLCFHSTLRGLFRRPRQVDLFRAYVLSLLVAVPLVWSMRQTGWIAPWIPPFAWPANLVGGFIFGLGMVIAATCITGIFYKLGHGMLGMLVALPAWALGDIVTYLGPLSAVRAWLNGPVVQVNGQNPSLLDLPPAGPVLVVAVWLAAAVWLWRSPRTGRGQYWGWPQLGLLVGLATSAAWLAARWGGSDYTYGTSGVPASLYLALSRGEPLWSPWITAALAGIVPGAFVAARRGGTLWVRGETARRYAQLAAGGFVMGVGAAIAGGCNLGHSLVGVPLLAPGSILTTLAMTAGVWTAHRASQWLKLGD
ncbi:MAG: YeeE/YedE family protein [Chloroflexi bacterium]|nr:MAG: YeeE/YedE family protein [Chloroflexota bacterium]